MKVEYLNCDGKTENQFYWFSPCIYNCTIVRFQRHYIQSAHHTLSLFIDVTFLTSHRIQSHSRKHGIMNKKNWIFFSLENLWKIYKTLHHEYCVVKEKKKKNVATNRNQKKRRKKNHCEAFLMLLHIHILFLFASWAHIPHQIIPMKVQWDYT